MQWGVDFLRHRWQDLFRFSRPLPLPQMQKHKGFILQVGSSPIDGRPFVVILTMNSKNRKTGNMAQVWILREDVDPVAAVASGADETICGDCATANSLTVLALVTSTGQAPLFCCLARLSRRRLPVRSALH